MSSIIIKYRGVTPVSVAHYEGFDSEDECVFALVADGYFPSRMDPSEVDYGIAGGQSWTNECDAGDTAIVIPLRGTAQKRFLGQTRTGERIMRRSGNLVVCRLHAASETASPAYRVARLDDRGVPHWLHDYTCDLAFALRQYVETASTPEEH